MKIKKISKKDPTVRETFTLKQSTVNMLQEYKAFYEETYKEPIEYKALVEEILLTFAAMDKDFVKFRDSLESVKAKKEETKNVPQSLTSLEE